MNWFIVCVLHDGFLIFLTKNLVTSFAFSKSSMQVCWYVCISAHKETNYTVIIKAKGTQWCTLALSSLIWRFDIEIRLE